MNVTHVSFSFAVTVVSLRVWGVVEFTTVVSLRSSVG